MFGCLNPFRNAQRDLQVARGDTRATLAALAALEMVTLAVATRAGTPPDQMVEPQYCTITCLTCARPVMARDVTGLEHDGHKVSVSRIDGEAT